MSMKDVVSLDVAKKLRDAGWTQADDHCMEHDYLRCPKPECVSKPTIGVLMDALPEGAQLAKARGPYSKLPTLFAACMDAERFYDDENLVRFTKTNRDVYKTNPADCLALLWLALKEKGLV